MAQKFLTHLDLNQNELQNAVVQNLGTVPGSPIAGQLYFDTNGGLNHIKVYNGTGWDDLTEGDIAGVTAGTGLTGGGTSGNVTLNLADTAVTANTYGSGTAIPVITIDAQGRITAASTANVATDLTIDADGASTEDVSLLSDDLQILGDTGITTSVSKAGTDVTVTIDLDDVIGLTAGSYGAADTVATFTVDQQGRLTAAADATISIASSQINDLSTTLVSSVSGTANEIEVTGTGSGPYTGAVTVGLPDDVTIGNDLTVSNNLTVTGDLTVNGATTTVNTATLSVEDPLIILGNNNDAADSVDLGFYGLYDTSGSQDLYAGLFRDADDSGKFKLFVDLETAPTTTVDTAGAGYTIGTLVANLEGGTVSGLTTDLAVADGGTGASTEATARTSLAATTSGIAGTTLARSVAVDCAASSGSVSATTVDHRFGSMDVSVQVYDTSTGETVVGQVVRATSAPYAVTVTLNGGSIASGDYRIIVTSAS